MPNVLGSDFISQTLEAIVMPQFYRTVELGHDYQDSCKGMDLARRKRAVALHFLYGKGSGTNPKNPEGKETHRMGFGARSCSDREKRMGYFRVSRKGFKGVSSSSKGERTKGRSDTGR